MQELQATTQRELQTAAACDGLCHRFDQAPDGTRVQKTTRRQIVTRELARFEAVEVVRTAPHEVGHRRSPLADLVPKGGTYGYDVMTHVGVLGELSALPRKLAEAGRTAGPWTRWRQAQQPLRAGRLPRRLVRAENFLDTLVVTYQDRCPSDAA